MTELARDRLGVNYRTIDQSLTILERDPGLSRILKGSRLALAFSGSPYNGGIFEVGAATAFTIERATTNWFGKNETPAISFNAIATTFKALLKISNVVGVHQALAGNGDYVEIYKETIRASQGDQFLARVESARHELFPALGPNIFYLGVCDLSLILGFEKARREDKLKEKYLRVVSLPVLNPYLQ